MANDPKRRSCDDATRREHRVIRDMVREDTAKSLVYAASSIAQAPPGTPTRPERAPRAAHPERARSAPRGPASLRGSRRRDASPAALGGGLRTIEGLTNDLTAVIQDGMKDKSVCLALFGVGEAPV